MLDSLSWVGCAHATQEKIDLNSPKNPEISVILLAE